MIVIDMNGVSHRYSLIDRSRLLYYQRRSIRWR